MRIYSLLCLFLLVFSSSNYAQITIQAEDMPVIGDEFIIGTDTAVSALSVGVAGNNRVWDFSTLAPHEFDTINIVAPNTLFGGDEFPMADFAIKTDTISSFVQKANEGLLYLGIAGELLETGISVVIEFDPAFKLVEIPTTVNTNFSAATNVREQIFYPLLNDSVRLSRREELYIETDGYGSLVLPTGVFNTLRQKRISITFDTLQAKLLGNWTNVSLTNDTTISYDWMSREAKGILFSAEVDESDRPISMSYTTNVVPALIAPKSNFTTTAKGDRVFKFRDRSSNAPDAWVWDFGDGNSSTAQNPEHTFAGPGDYNVCLTASNSEGDDTFCKTVSVAEAPTAGFEIEKKQNGSYDFTDRSSDNSTNWSWDFGDGSTSAKANPSHAYTSPGEYTVCLIVSNSGGSDTICQQLVVTLIPTAGFGVQPRNQGEFDFTDLSGNEPMDWQWDFGDGNTSTMQNPRHAYSSPGEYTACLIASNSEGADTICRSITVVFAPEVAFEVEAKGNGLFDFKDLSSNKPTGWNWDFGDGNSSSDGNPQHSYSSPGTYTVCLEVTNSAGSDAACQTIRVVLIPNAGFTTVESDEGTYNFTDASGNEPTGWQWDFGDGNSSNMQNPSHSYASPGTYTVCLVASNAEGADTICQSLKVVFIPQAGFEVNAKGDGNYDFKDNSSNEPTDWKWDFGDGKKSSRRNPSHTYSSPGDYTVCLIVTNAAGADTVCQSLSVGLLPDAGFSTDADDQDTYNFSDMSGNNPSSWKWDFGDGNTSDAQNPQHTYVAPGEYTVCLIATNAEGSDTTCQKVVVVFAPETAFAYEDKGERVFRFTDQTTNSPTTWLWDFDDNTTSTEQNPEHTFSADGTYSVCRLATSNSAGADITCQTVMVGTTPTSNVLRELGMKVFPNPASDHFVITLGDYQGPALQLSITNAFGQLIHQSVIQDRAHINSTQWPTGDYFYRLQTKEGESLVTGQIIINK